MSVLLETSLGDIVIDLKVDHAPETCKNFLKLCKLKYYHNCIFHTVQKNFLCQTGDPTNTGKGGASVHAKLPGAGRKFIDDEITPALKHNVKGTVGMANVKANENGSQFYFTLRDRVESLDGKHTIFGTVAEGLEVLDQLNAVMLDEHDAPFQNVRIWHTEILEDPFDDPAGLEALIPPKSPEPIEDEEFKKIEGQEDEQVLQERMAKTLAKSQATTLELLHDLPDADIAPPDNDLFVYKLNPITQDGDLELIFSRFGPIKSCEIVRDWKTGDSLQYGFIIYENARDCENAYFKMHDCVIDDRRIGVNFSQSVAKMWNKFRTGSKMSKDDLDEAGAKGRSKGKGKGKGKGKEGGKPDGGKNGAAGPKAGTAAPASPAEKARATAPAPGRPRSPARAGRAGAAEPGRGAPRERREQGSPRRRSRSRDGQRARDRSHDRARDRDRARPAAGRSRSRRRR